MENAMSEAERVAEIKEAIHRHYYHATGLCHPGLIATDVMEILNKALQAERKKADLWQEDAKRYAGNADYWRKKFEDEREACARVADDMGKGLDNEWNRKLGKASDLVETCEEIAEAIRSRG